MGKLLNAPLVEVIFEIKWNSNSPQEIQKFQLLIGAMHVALHQNYSTPIALIPDPNIPINVFVGSPTHRFTNLDDPNMLYQIGPGVLSINYVGANYDWEIFFAEIKQIVNTLKKSYDFSNEQEFVFALKYLDFFEINPTSKNLFEFLKENFHIDFHIDLITNPLTLGFNASHKINDSIFNMSINTGNIAKDNKQKPGLIVESMMSEKAYSNNFSDWEATTDCHHSYLSDFFKKMTKGSLYESFK